MDNGAKQPIALPFLISLGVSVVFAPYYRSGEADWIPEWYFVVLLFAWPVMALGFSAFLIQRTARQFRLGYAGAGEQFDAWRSNVSQSFSATATIIVAVVLGALPQVWLVVSFWPSKGVLIVPLGVIAFLQCLIAAWCIAVLAFTLAPGMRIGTILAHLMFLSAYVGVSLLLRNIGNRVALPYLGGNRVDGFSPVMLYLQRFVHDRPVSRLHLMYATSLTMFAFGGMLLLIVSFVIAYGRSRRGRMGAQTED